MTHTFPGKPLVLVISSINNTFSVFLPYGMTMADAGLTNGVRSIVNVTWNGNTVTWIGSTRSGNQLNSKGTNYQVIALIAADA